MIAYVDVIDILITMTRGQEYITLPGLVDLHVHLRQPGLNNAETIASGTRAALLGGYAMIADMPNNPGNPTWTEGAMLEKHAIARTDSYIPVGFYAGWQPESEEEITELVKMSYMAVGLKFYGAPTTGNDKDYEAGAFMPAITAWHNTAPDKPIMFHAGKDNLGDMINIVSRFLGHHLHVCHVNSPDQVKEVSKAKANGLNVTCGVCPHHLLKTSHDVNSEGWFARMQPPLADQTDSEQLMALLANGEIDVVETDHAPHSESAKWKAETENQHGIHEPGQTTCFGVPGIEFAAPLFFYQAKRGRISMERLVDAMSTRPAEILGVRLTNSTKFTWEMRDYRIEGEGETYVKSGSDWTPYLGKLALGILKQATVRGKDLVSSYAASDAYPRVIRQRGEEI